MVPHELLQVSDLTERQMARLQASKEIGRGVNVRDASLAQVESIPAYDDDNYILDGEGNRILIGLTVDETREFEHLDELMSYANFVPTDDSHH